MQSMRLMLLYYLPLLGWLGVIYYLSSLPGLAVSTGWTDFMLRKGAHFVEYLVLCLLIYRLLARHALFSRYRLWVALFLTAIYAASDEYHQSLVPTRSGNLTDWWLDTTGALAGAGVIKYGQVDSFIK